MTGPQLTVRPLAAGEEDLYRRIVFDAAAFRDVEYPPMDELLATAHYRPYVEGWGRTGDRCLVACLGETPVGGVFYRLFAPPQVGDGFVDESTPELGIALFAGHRGCGLGRLLLHAALTQARLDGHPGLSLGVADDNPAGHLYTSVGFQVHAVIPRGRVMLFPLPASRAA